MKRAVRGNPQFKIVVLLTMMGFSACWGVSADADDNGKGELNISGIEISGGFTTILQSTDGAPVNATDLSYSLDLGLQARVSPHGKVVVALEAGDGLGVDATLGSLSSANYDAFYTNLITLTADVQLINNNGGDGSADAVTVAGLRGQLNF